MKHLKRWAELTESYGNPALILKPSVHNSDTDNLRIIPCPLEVAIFKVDGPDEYIVCARYVEEDAWLPNCAEKWVIKELVPMVNNGDKYFQEISEHSLTDYFKRAMQNRCSKYTLPATVGIHEYAVTISDAATVCSSTVKIFIEDFVEWAFVQGYRIVERDGAGNAIWSCGGEKHTTVQLRAIYFNNKKQS